MAEGKKYHINPETGKPNVCTATGKRGCKYKAEDGTEPPHFPTKEAAQAHQNSKDAEEYGSVATVKKNGGERGEQKREILDEDEMKQVVSTIMEEEEVPAAKAAPSPVEEFHARGEKRIRELQEAELNLDEQVVDLEAEIADVRERVHDLEELRDSLDEHQRMEVDGEIDELTKRGDDLGEEYEEKVEYLKEARGATAQARAKYLGTMDERAQMAEIDGNMESLRGEVIELEAVVKERMTAIEGGDTSEEARENLNSALASKAIARTMLEEERERRFELQGNIYSRATGKQASRELTPREEKMRDATVLFHERGNALEEAEFNSRKAERALRMEEENNATEAPSKEQEEAYKKAVNDATESSIAMAEEQAKYRDAMSNLLLAQNMVNQERGES